MAGEAGEFEKLADYWFMFDLFASLHLHFYLCIQLPDTIVNLLQF